MATTLADPGGMKLNRVDVTKPDGTGVIVHSENVATDGKTGGQPASREPLFTHEQLIEIALAPGLTIYP